MACHFVSSHEGETDTRNETKPQHFKEDSKVEGAWIGCMQHTFMCNFMASKIPEKNASHLVFMWNDDQQNLFLHGDIFTFENIWL